MAAIAAERDLLFGLLALQNGLIDQVQLVAAFQARTRDKARSLAEHLAARGDLDDEQRAGVEAMVALHIKKHGGDVERSLGAVAASKCTRESLANLGDPDVEATLGRVGSASGLTELDCQVDFDRTTDYSVGTATSDGQRFRILRPHAQGGLGTVFVALDSELKREVALKQIRDSHADDPVSRQRFVAEAEITGGLEHPGVVPVYGLGTDAVGRPYYAMRFIKGESLKEAVEGFHRRANRKSPSLPVGEGQSGATTGTPAGSRDLEFRKLLRRFLDVCNAIDYAHSRGVIHRDLKPSNIIVGKHGETLVVDWGLAKVVGRADPSVAEQTLAPSSSGSSETLPGSALGTPAYMSPEQARGDLAKLGPRSDVYCLGATLYCLLTGKPPFSGDGVGEILHAVQEGQYPRPSQHDPSVDKALDAVCVKAMAARPEDRYATPKALADDIERWLADEPVTAWREPLSRRAGRWARRHRTAVTSLAASVTVALAGTVAVLAVQTQANGRLQQANSQLMIANGRVTKANAELNSANEREKQRFNLAMDAIKLFHGEVSEDLLLKEKQFEGLRTKLLKGAADFYGRLEGLLNGQTDRESRRALGRAYGELALLTGLISDQKAALAVLGKALTVRRALASEPVADARAKLDLAGSLDAAGWYQRLTGDLAGARASYEEAQRLAEEVDAEGGGAQGAREMLGNAYHGIGQVLNQMGDPAGARAAFGQALAIRQKLADANATNARLLSDLAGTTHNTAMILEFQGLTAEARAMYERARSVSERAVQINGSVPRYKVFLANHHESIGILMYRSGDARGAQAEYGQTLAIRQKLADANPNVTEFQQDLARIHNNIGLMLSDRGDPAGARAAYDKALAIQQKLTDANPSVNGFQQDLARSHNNMALLLTEAGDLTGALAAYAKALAIRQKLADANPNVPEFQLRLAHSHHSVGWTLSKTGHPDEARASLEKALAIQQKVADANPNVPDRHNDLASSYTNTADVFRRLGRNALARENYDRAIVIRERLVDQHPQARLYRSHLAWSLRRRGLTLVDPGDPAGAAADTRRALEIRDGLPSRSGEEWFETACCHATLAALAGRVGSGVSTAEADMAMVLLKKAVGMGYRSLATYRDEPALVPLRDRDDFRLMMMDLAMPAQPFASAR